MPNDLQPPARYTYLIDKLRERLAGERARRAAVRGIQQNIDLLLLIASPLETFWIRQTCIRVEELERERIKDGIEAAGLDENVKRIVMEIIDERPEDEDTDEDDDEDDDAKKNPNAPTPPPEPPAPAPPTPA